MNGRPAQDGSPQPPEHGRRRHIGVVTFPAYAHIAPALPMLTELVRRGHRVTCLVAERFVDAIKETGAEPVVYESSFPWATGLTGSMMDTILTFFEESIATLPAAVARFDHDRPDLLAHDLAACDGVRLLARGWDVPAVQLCPTIASSPGFSMSGHQAKEVSQPPEPIDPEDPRITEFVARKDRLLAELGLDGVPPETVAPEYGDNIVFLPKAFQIAPETFDDRFTFIGPAPAEAPEDGVGWQPPEGRRVLLMTQGTSYHPDQAEFMRSCVQALAGTPWHVVMTLGHRVTPDDLGPLPGNIEAHQWLRHPEVLRHAEAFITHGGMGSVMEALSFGVPMVLVPYHIECRVIARQAADLGLGRVVLREDFTPDALRAAIEEVTSSPRIAAASAALRRAVHEAGGAALGADTVESLIRRRAQRRSSPAPATEVTLP